MGSPAKPIQATAWNGSMRRMLMYHWAQFSLGHQWCGYHFLGLHCCQSDVSSTAVAMPQGLGSDLAGSGAEEGKGHTLHRSRP